MPASTGRRGERGAAMLLAILLMGLVLVAAAVLLRVAGADRIDAARLGTREHALECADRGLQYARRFFGQRYEVSNNWNDLLAGPNGSRPGYRYDPAHFVGDQDYFHASKPGQALGKSDGTHFDPGSDADGDGRPDFWVSVRDDDDEAPMGLADDATRDNNEAIIIRSQCIAWTYEENGQQVNAVVEAVLRHVQGASGYGSADKDSNQMDAAMGGATARVTSF